MSFWLQHNRDAIACARCELGDERFDAVYAAGAAARDEVIIDETCALLQEAAAGRLSRPLPAAAGAPKRRAAT
jgi:hypothetical protein